MENVEPYNFKEEVELLKRFKRQNDDERWNIVETFRDELSPKCDQRYADDTGFMCSKLEKTPWDKFISTDINGIPFRSNFICDIDHCPLLQ